VQRSKRSEEISRELVISTIKQLPPILRQQISQHKPYQGPSSRNEVQRSKRSEEISREIAISLIKERPPILRQQTSQHEPFQSRHLATKCSAANEVKRSPQK